MNRDFETAYKELAENEVPDLWDRIEAGLGEKSAPVNRKAESGKNTVSDRAKAGSGEKIILVRGRSRTELFIRKYATLAAAVVCLMILIPTAIMLRQASGKSLSESAATAEAFTTAEMAEKAEAETVEEAGAAAWEEAAAEEAVAAEEAPAEAVTEMAEAVGEEPVKEAAAMADEAKEAQPDMLAQQAAAGKKEQFASTLTNVTIKVEKVQEQPENEITNDNAELEETGIYYTVIVQNDPSGVLKEGEEITLFVPVTSSARLSLDGIFELDLALSEKSDYIYTVTEYHRQLTE
ncbi:MAG: hypothetical protein ACI4SD_01590 [Suilimivivens sp.]